VVPQSTTTGTETLRATLKDATQLPANGGPFTLLYNGSQWTATNQASGKTFNLGSGTTLAFRGIEVDVSGTPSAGDRFSLDPVAGAAANLAMTTSDPDAIAAAVPYVATAGAMTTSGNILNMNAGTADIAPGKVSDQLSANALTVPASDFEQNLQVKFTSPSVYQVQTAAGTVIASGAYSAANGGAIAIAYPAGAAGGKYWQMSVSGEPATGDTFTLSPGGAQSGGNADALGSLQSAPIVQGGSLNDAWSYVTDAIGTATQSAKTSQDNASTSVKSAQAARDAVSGVSLDEQAGELQLYVQAYQAAAKAMSTTNQLFQSLLSAV
jgi:flagellar hook-associated protein 1 FlgK